MDNMHLPERPQNGSIGLDTNRRISSRSLPIPDSSGHMPPTPQIVTVVVHKDVNGYGMKVSGDNPVFVQSVRDGGAAERAGLQAGDTIIKVNGEDVIKSTHTEVVALIRSTTHVKLTVKQHPRMLRPHVGSPVPTHHQNSRNLMVSHHHPSSTQITAPQPVDHEKLRQFENERVHLIRMMLEKAQTHVEALRSELASLPTNADSSKLVADLQIAERTVGKLQTELQTCLSFTTHDGLSASSHSHTLPKSLTVPSSPHSSIPQSKSATQIFDTPPPLPNRNKINDLNSVNLSRSSTRLRSTEHLDNHKNYHPRNLYHKSPSQSPVDCNLVENQLYHSKFKDLDNSDIMLANYHRKNALSPKSSPGKHNKLSKRVKGSNSNLSYEGASANSNINEPDVPPPLPPRIPLHLDPFLNNESSGAPSTPSPSGIIEPDAVNSINKQMSYPLVATCAALVNNPIFFFFSSIGVLIKL